MRKRLLGIFVTIMVLALGIGAAYRLGYRQGQRAAFLLGEDSAETAGTPIYIGDNAWQAAWPPRGFVDWQVPGENRTGQEKETTSGASNCLASKLPAPLGSVTVLQGIVGYELGKGYESGLNIHVQRINGLATQEDVRIPLRPYSGDLSTDSDRRPALEAGATYELEGYETGSFVGTPPEAYRGTGLTPQTASHQFLSRFVVYKGKKIDRIRFSPADFIDRRALLEGRALSENDNAYMAGDGWRLLVDDSSPWPEDVEDKLVEGYGHVREIAAAHGYRLDNGMTRLVRLDDQVGRKVELRGTARENLFYYRGTEVHIECMGEHGAWGDPILLEGILEKVEHPTAETMRFTYQVRQAACERLERPLAPDW